MGGQQRQQKAASTPSRQFTSSNRRRSPGETRPARLHAHNKREPGGSFGARKGGVAGRRRAGACGGHMACRTNRKQRPAGREAALLGNTLPAACACRPAPETARVVSAVRQSAWATTGRDSSAVRPCMHGVQARDDMEDAAADAGRTSKAWHGHSCMLPPPVPTARPLPPPQRPP